MLDSMINALQNSEFMLSLLVFLAVGATIITFAWPYLEGDALGDRMRTVAVERERLRKTDIERLSVKGLARQTSKPWATRLVEQFNLVKLFGQDGTKEKLERAGYRTPSSYTTYLVIRFLTPIIVLIVAAFYLFFLYESQYSVNTKIIMVGVCAAFGYIFPSIMLTNKIQKREESIGQAFPDALDLLLICIESGMAVEVALKKVSEEIGSQSIALAEELTLTTAELSFLPERTQAYENLARRVNLDGVKAVVLALNQAEKYGTPLGQAMRVMAQENRDIRMSEAERKAAGIPPKLTIPMIVFFLPVLFIIILGPPAIRVMGLK